MKILTLALALLAVSTGTTRAQDVLIFGPGGQLSRPYFGPVDSVTVADAATWTTLSTEDFQAYDLIWIEGNNCATTDVQAVARTTQSVWGPAVNGRLMFMTGDIDYHANLNDGRSRDFVGRVVDWLTDTPGTALMLNTGCTAQGTAPATVEQWRPAVGAALTQASRANYNGTIVDGSHPLMTGFSVANMAWGNTCHGSIGAFPAGFVSVHGRSAIDHCIIVREAVECTSSSQCDDGNTCTEDTCVANTCVRTPVAAGTMCAGGVCSGASAMCVQCVGDTDCGGATPRCQLSTNTCVECLAALECDDANGCTTDACSAAGACTNTPVAEGTACADGVCASGGMCVECLMDAQCEGATPRCDTTANVCLQCLAATDCEDGDPCTVGACAAGSCSQAPAPAGTVCAGGVCNGVAPTMCVTCVDDTQCAGGTPFCVTNECVTCRSDADCDDGNECTTNACGAGACMTTPLGAGTSCSLGVCTPSAVCTAVAVQIVTPDDGDRVGTSTPTIEGTATPGTTVTVTIDGDEVGTATAGADGTWSVTPSAALPDGMYMVTASVSTSNGDAMDASSFVVDTETEVAITSPADGGTTLDSTPNIRGTGEPGATVVVTIDGEEVGTATVGGDGTWVVMVTEPLMNGEYTAEATATDSVGNTATATSTFTVEANTDVAITSPANGSSTNDTTPTITGTAVPGATVVVTIEVDGETREIGTVTADDEGDWSVEVTEALPEGTYTATATATDPAGNMGSDDSTFTVDTQTTVMITDVDPTGRVTGTGEPGATVVVTVDGVEVGTTTVGEDGTWTVDIDPLGPGTYEVTATGTDPAGNTASDSTTITVAMSDGGVMPDAGPGVDGGGVDAGRLEGSYSGGALCAASAGAEGAGDPLALFVLSLVGLVLWRRRRG